MQYLNSSMIGKEEEIIIQAESYDHHSNLTFKCQEVFTAYLVGKENMTIFPTKYDVTNLYSVNFPKPLEIPLGHYATGPNV